MQSNNNNDNNRFNCQSTSSDNNPFNCPIDVTTPDTVGNVNPNDMSQLSSPLTDPLSPNTPNNDNNFNNIINKIVDNPFGQLQSQEEEEALLLASQLLTRKQQTFCEYYVKSFNAAKAAADAGYSIQSASAIGYALLKKPEIQAYIESLRQINSHKYQHTVIDELFSLYQQAKGGQIVYQLPNKYGNNNNSDNNDSIDDIPIARPIMVLNTDGTISPLREKPDFKVALEALRTIAEYTIPKATPDGQANNKLAIANKYIQNNTYLQQSPQQQLQQQLIQQHINKVIGNK